MCGEEFTYLHSGCKHIVNGKLLDTS